MIATGFRVGHMPFAPGTIGSLEGLVLCYLLARMSVASAVVIIIGVILFAIWVSHEAEKALGAKDPGCVVIDEVAGMMVTMMGLPFTPLTAAAGFSLFRVLDIVKPPPIRQIQDSVPGGAGIVLDDVAAGVMANLLLRLLLSITEMA